MNLPVSRRAQESSAEVLQKLELHQEGQQALVVIQNLKRGSSVKEMKIITGKIDQESRKADKEMKSRVSSLNCSNKPKC